MRAAYQRHRQCESSQNKKKRKENLYFKLTVARKCLRIDYEAFGKLLLGVFLTALEGQKIGPLRQGSEVNGLILAQSGTQ